MRQSLYYPFTCFFFKQKESEIPYKSCFFLLKKTKMKRETPKE